MNDIMNERVITQFRSIINSLIEAEIFLNREYVSFLYEMQNNYLSDIFILSNNINFEIINYNRIKYKSDSKSLTEKSSSKLMSLGFDAGKFLESEKMSSKKL